jgi:hypothetical protein
LDVTAAEKHKGSKVDGLASLYFGYSLVGHFEGRMQIIGNRRVWADSKDWDSVNFAGLMKCKQELFSQPQSADRDEQIADMVQAGLAANGGGKVWMAKGTFQSRMYFAVGERFVPESECYFDLTEIIEDASFSCLSENHAKADLTDNEPLAVIIDYLKNDQLVEETLNGVLFDSLASEDEFRKSVFEAVEYWDSQLPESTVEDSDSS